MASCLTRACGRVNVIVMGTGLAGRVQFIPLEEVLNKSEEKSPPPDWSLLSSLSEVETGNSMAHGPCIWRVVFEVKTEVGCCSVLT